MCVWGGLHAGNGSVLSCGCVPAMVSSNMIDALFACARITTGHHGSVGSRTVAGQGRLPHAVYLYCWLHPENPSPAGYTGRLGGVETPLL